MKTLNLELEKIAKKHFFIDNIAIDEEMHEIDVSSLTRAFKCRL